MSKRPIYLFDLDTCTTGYAMVIYYIPSLLQILPKLLSPRLPLQSQLQAELSNLDGALLDAIWLQPDIPRFIPFPDELGIAWPFGVYTWVYHIFQAHPCWWCWCRYAEVWWCSTKKRHDWTIGAHGSSVLLEVPILDCHIPKSLCGWHTFSSHSKQVSLLQSSFRVSVKKKIDHNRPM